jgi:hypothetical protein
MIPVIPIISFLYEIEIGKNGVGCKEERENEIKRLRE